MSRRLRRVARAALEAGARRDDMMPAMSPAQRLVGFGLVAVSLGFTSLLVLVQAVWGLFR